MGNFSKYKIFIVGLYVILFPLFFIFTPHALRYDFSTVNLPLLVLLVAGTVLAFYLLNLFFGFYQIEWRHPTFSESIWRVVYAVLFAVPEEIIFRGIVQGALQNSLSNVVLIVFISSAVFGLAHVPNGAGGLHITDWNWQFAAITFLAGLPLGLTFALTGSLLVPTLLHALFLAFFLLFIREKDI